MNIVSLQKNANIIHKYTQRRRIINQFLDYYNEVFDIFFLHMDYASHILSLKKCTYIQKL